ncbi:MAG: amidase [Alicyclobacillus sp.]|nr:amidase [Alicyclobacillus sp.]
MTPHHWSIAQTRRALMARELSAVELVTWYLQRIRQTQATLGAFIWVDEEGAVQQAQSIDASIARGSSLPPLAGIPLAVKDLFDIAGMPSTYGGRHFVHHRPAATATAVARLVQAGAIVIGKANLHEYAFGTSGENPHFGNAHNPWNRHKITGGSSSGTAAAIVAGLAVAGLGTDTGGSIRIPASLTGHVGFKPTYGLVSKYGVFPLAPSLDHVGPMAKSVADAALLLHVMAGYDPLDPASIRTPCRTLNLPDGDAARPGRASADPSRPLRGWRLGLPRQFFFERCHNSVLHVVQSVLQELERAGVEMVEVDIPGVQDVPALQNALLTAEAADVHRHRMDQLDEFGEDVRQRLESAAGIPGADVVRAYAFQRKFRAAATRVFETERIDAVVTPTTALAATDIGQSKTHIRAIEVPVRSHLTRYTNPWNFSGLPAISIPCGHTQDDLPVGLQLVGAPFADAKLLKMASQMEAHIGWNPIAPLYR